MKLPEALGHVPRSRGTESQPGFVQSELAPIERICICRRRAGLISSLSPATAAAFQIFPQQKLDLRVQAAQVILRPALKLVEHLCWKPQQE